MPQPATQTEQHEPTREDFLRDMRHKLENLPEDYCFVFVAVSQADPDAMAFLTHGAYSRAIPVAALRRAAMIVDSEWAAEWDFGGPQGN